MIIKGTNTEPVEGISPYDAPKFDSENKIINKCNLCYSGLTEGRQPACSSSCPTGALEFGVLSEPKSDQYFPWFPEKMLNPALVFTARRNENSLKIIPDRILFYIDFDPLNINTLISKTFNSEKNEKKRG
jgi:Fe-S-cluster-containing dehydrogenase component